MTGGPSTALAAALLGVLFLLTGALAVAFVRLVAGPSAPDRVVALDLVGGVSVGIVAVYSAYTGEHQLLRVAMGLALISFLGTVAVARYLERSARR
jgi:multicomponent Na+:H+ antiporter subunit F